MSTTVKLNAATLAKLRKIHDDAVRDAGEHLLETANRTVPLEEATLERSGQVTTERSGTTTTAAVSYDTPYARRQHEDKRLRHDPGRRAKWLERTAEEEEAAIRGVIVDSVRRATP